MSRNASPMVSDIDTLIILAIRQARRFGMQQEDAQDCAMDFVQRLVRLHPSRHHYPRTWVHKAAYHQALRYHRRLTRDQSRECAYEEEPTLRSAEPHLSWRSPIMDPCMLALRQALWTELRRALGKLTALQRELFVEFYLRHHSVPEIASRLGRTPHAVYEGLISARKRLAVLLQRAGWTAQEAQQLFQPVSRALPVSRFDPGI